MAAASEAYADTVLAELALARAGARRRRRRRSTRSSSAAARRPCSPPTTWPGSSTAIDKAFGLAADAEVTTEANPESVDPASLRAAAPGRLHPDLAGHAVGRARTCWPCSTGSTRPVGRAAAARRGPRRRVRPRQPRPDLRHARGDAPRTSPPRCDAAVAAGVDHVSAYSLIVEDGTRLAARIRRGEMPVPDDDVAADRYLAAEAALERGRLRLVRGLQLGPVADGDRCRHNLLYWRGGDWWGFGPGAHSHVGGVRWWNVKHPTRVRRAAGRRARQPGARAGGAHGRRARTSRT